MAHSSPQTFMWLGKPPLCHSLVRPLHHPLLQTHILRLTPLSSSQTAWPWPAQLSALRIFALMSLQAPVGLSSQTGVSFTAPPPTCHLSAPPVRCMFSSLKFWSTESLILPSCPDGAFDQYYSWVFVLESIVHLESDPHKWQRVTKGSWRRCRSSVAEEAERRQKAIQPILRTWKAFMKVILQYLCLVNTMTCPKVNFSLLRALRMQTGAYDHVMPQPPDLP